MTPENLDPRIRRTRQMLFQALDSLLKEKAFEDITVQDLAERSTVNRATVYSHFQDKFALLGAMVEEEFAAAFSERMQGASGTCREGVKRLILAVCDYFGKIMACCPNHGRPFAPVVEAKVRDIVRDFLLNDLRAHANISDADEAGVRATAAAWAICGTAVDWSKTKKPSPEVLAETVLPLVAAGLLIAPKCSSALASETSTA